ncbi:hypothetical protein CCR96_00580 [Halochromatium roseum]|nr:hypothetical protein [Halochromatium roseum]
MIRAGSHLSIEIKHPECQQRLLQASDSGNQDRLLGVLRWAHPSICLSKAQVLDEAALQINRSRPPDALAQERDGFRSTPLTEPIGT